MQGSVDVSLEPVVLAVFTLYLALVGAWDLKTLRVPNRLTLPAMVAVLLWRAVRIVLHARAGLPVLPELALLPYWAGIWMLWQVSMMGGGDAKLLMVLFGVFPKLEFLGILLAISGLTMALVLVLRYGRRRKLGLLVSGFLFRLTHGRLFPTEAELAAEGEPTAFLFSIAGMVMVLLEAL